jgi:hypothetical protein
MIHTPDRRVALACFVIVLGLLAHIEAATPITVPPPVVQDVLNAYCKSLGSKNVDAYGSVFHINGHRDWESIKRFWKEHDTTHTVRKSELLFQDDDMMIVRLYTDILWRDYKPPFTSEEDSLVVLRRDDSAWKVWSVSQLDVRKKE